MSAPSAPTKEPEGTRPRVGMAADHGGYELKQYLAGKLSLPTETEGLDSLAELALDLRWPWNHATDHVWRQLDPALCAARFNFSQEHGWPAPSQIARPVTRLIGPSVVNEKN